MAEFFPTSPQAGRLQVSEEAVRRRLTSGEMPDNKTGGQYRGETAELDTWIRDQTLSNWEPSAFGGGDA